MKLKRVIGLVLVVAVLLVPVVASAALNTSGLERAGEDIQGALEKLLGNSFGKAIFMLAMAIALVTLIFVPKARGYMIAVLIVGALIASYAGLTDTLWTFFQGLFSKSGSGGNS